MHPAITTKDVIKEFPAGDEGVVQVLHGISLTTYNGELSMLVGPSGCGKTTLLSIISGILTPTSGSVNVNGTTVTALSDRAKVEFRRREMGFIFQQFNLLPALTAAENASVALVAGGVPLSRAVVRAGEVLALLGMKDHLHKLPSQLSGGQQQRVAIARALVHEPKLIVCDEPTASLDAHTGQQVIELLKKVAGASGKSVLVVTHDQRIFSYADRLFIMGDGKLEKVEEMKGGSTWNG